MRDLRELMEDNRLADIKLSQRGDYIFAPEGEGYGRSFGEREIEGMERLRGLNSQMRADEPLTPAIELTPGVYMRRGRYPQSDFLSEIENDPRIMLGRDEMAQIPFSELLTGGEYEDPGFEMNLPGGMEFQAVPQDSDFRGRGVEGRGRVAPTQEIPSSGQDFMPSQMQRRFRNQNLSPAAQEAFAFPVESGETTIDAKRRALRQLEEAMTDEQRLEYEIQKQNWLRDQRLR